MKTNEQLKAELYAPLPAEAIKPHPTKTFLSTIKPIYVTDRLNEVFGIGGWQLRTENILVKDNGTVVNKIMFSAPEYNIYYECFGGNDNGGGASKGFDLGDAFKGATTDGLTKICSYLGIGIDVFRGKQQASKPAYQAPTQVNISGGTSTGTAYDKNIVAKMQPSIGFDDSSERKAKAGKALEAVKSLGDVKTLISKQKEFKATKEGELFNSGASVADIIKLNNIDVLLNFYKFVK